jgi:hypothetical protein
MEDQKRFSKHKIVREQGYIKYDNYDAIEVPYVDAILSDYTGVLGVPISFLDKRNPEQYEIVTCTVKAPMVNGEYIYKRILILKRYPPGTLAKRQQEPSKSNAYREPLTRLVNQKSETVGVRER